MRRAIQLGLTAVVAIALGMPLSTAVGASGTTSMGAPPEPTYTNLQALLFGWDEVPSQPWDDASGFATINVQSSPYGDTICVFVEIEEGSIGSVIGVYIQQGAAGVNGPVVVTLPSSDGCAPMPPGSTVVAGILADSGGYYVNVLTDEYPTGAVRGQLMSEEAAPAGTAFLLPEPVRVYDSRTSPEGALTLNTPRTISLRAGVDGAGHLRAAAPRGANSAQVTLTATDSTRSGFMTIWSADAAIPGTSSLNWTARGDVDSVFTTVVVNEAGQVQVLAGGGVDHVHVVIDVTGYTM